MAHRLTINHGFITYNLRKCYRNASTSKTLNGHRTECARAIIMRAMKVKMMCMSVDATSTTIYHTNTRQVNIAYLTLGHSHDPLPCIMYNVYLQAYLTMHEVKHAPIGTIGKRASSAPRNAALDRSLGIGRTARQTRKTRV